MRDKLFICADTIVGNLTVIAPIERSDPRVEQARTPRSYVLHGNLWKCLCSCGSIVYYSQHVLQYKQVKSCGCLYRSRSNAKFRQMELSAQIKQLDAEIAAIRPSYLTARRLGNALEESRLLKITTSLYERKQALKGNKK